MDIATVTALALACAPLVHHDTALALVAVESAFNPHAIGVVGGALDRQPRTLAEAVATAGHLQSTGWNFSVGLAQINLHNFERLGMNAVDAFDPCKNLRAMQTVLVDCFERSRGTADEQLALRRALSCYYSGNATTGFDHGYVSRVVSYARKASRAPP
jgi:type IV secretion system protein VirB1